ncbi:MAG: AAC(3) family N-acetyltransferase [Alphaproteobacteria bacterium]|nr:AAC(3) family N-acetyltransferase [Alphaproteobacteria bacterium]
MPIPKTSDAELIDYLRSLGLCEGHHVLVHSRLLSLGVLERGVASVFDALVAAVGDTGTVCVPAFNLYMPEGFVFDPASTPPQGMGSLTNFVWDRGGWTRSACPINSHLCIGAKAHLMNDVSGTVSLGEGCDFQQFLDHGFHLLMLGLTYNEGASYMHYVEYCARSPYRTTLQLPRKRRDADGVVRDIWVDYYGRPSADMDDNNRRRAYLENYNAVEKVLTDRKLLTRRDCAFGYSTYAAIRTVHDTAMEMLREDPYAMVLENREEP